MDTGKRWIFASATALLALLLNGCGKPPPPADDTVYEAVDTLFDSVLEQTADYTVVTTIDHARLAAKTGVTMPPARVLIFSSAETNSLILQQNPLAGIDLPFKVLAYQEGKDEVSDETSNEASEDGTEAALVYTSAEFIQQRHGLSASPALTRYRDEINGVMGELPERVVTLFDTTAVVKDVTLKTLSSRYSFAETIQRLQEAIMAEGDTVWFGELDYQAEAGAFDIDLPPLTLLLFGAPEPGGKAMAEFPRLGLDAFCQKVLVHEGPDGQVTVYYNSMVGLAELHYGRSALVHRVIDFRMGSTLGGAVE